MNPREWRAVGLIAGLLCALSLWARLPAPWRWPAAGALVVIVALGLVVALHGARRRRTGALSERPSGRKPKPIAKRREADPPTPATSPETRRTRSSDGRRGSPVAHPYPSRDALRLVDRTGGDLPANFRR